MAGSYSRRARRRATFLVVKALGVACATAAVAAAAGAAPAVSPAPPKWLAPRNLSQATANAIIPDVVVDSKGDAIVVWAQAIGSSSTVDAADRPPGGPWSPPQALSAPADHVASPQIAISGSNVIAAWERYDGSSLVVQAADRDPKTGTWSAPKSVSPTGRDAQSVRVAVDAHGDAVAVWASVSLSTGWTIQSAYRPAGSSWQPPVELERAQAGTAAPTVVLDTAGNATAAWASTSGGGWKVHTASRGPDGTWTKPITLSGLDANGQIAPQLAVEGTNDVTAVWSRTVVASAAIELTTRNAATGAWSAPKQIFPTSSNALGPLIAVNKRGDGVIVWTSSDRPGLAVVASFRPAGQPWGPPTVLASAGSGPFTPQVALDARGDALVVWSDLAAGHSRVQAAGLAAGGSSWSAPQTLSTPGADALTPRVGLDDQGDGAATWAQYGGQSFVIQAAGYDASGPELNKLAVPATGVVGRHLVFTVTAKDVWSTVRTIRWRFGDGTAGQGKVTGHTYRRPGRYAADVAATDSLGHVRSIRRWVKISSA